MMNRYGRGRGWCGVAIAAVLIAGHVLPGGSAAYGKSSDSVKNESKSASKKSGESQGKSKKTVDSGERKSSKSSQENQAINPSAFNQTLMSSLVFDLTNVERRRAGLSTFKSNVKLNTAAVRHSTDMASRQYFDHNSKGILHRSSPQSRINACGYKPAMTAENIAMIPTYNKQVIQSYPGYGSQVIEADYNSYARLADYAVQEWMKSPGHRRNILNGQLSQLGVGTAIGIKGNVPYVYLTQDFGG